MFLCNVFCSRFFCTGYLYFQQRHQDCAINGWKYKDFDHSSKNNSLHVEKAILFTQYQGVFHILKGVYVCVCACFFVFLMFCTAVWYRMDWTKMSHQTLWCLTHFIASPRVSIPLTENTNCHVRCTPQRTFLGYTNASWRWRPHTLSRDVVKMNDLQVKKGNPARRPTSSAHQQSRDVWSEI